MKLIGLMVVKNEDWILEASLEAALRWCDEIVFVDTGSWDRTEEILHEVKKYHPWRIHFSRMTPTKKEEIWTPEGKAEVEVEDPEGWWDEMYVRQHALELGRKYGGTHFGLIDADEIPTLNVLYRIYNDTAKLKPGEVLEYPMLAMRTLDEYQDDGSVWSTALISTAFADKPGLTWKPDALGYHFHHRCPYGVSSLPVRPLRNKHEGGIMHLQFADPDRLRWKHVLYKMTEVIRWPNRASPLEVDQKYSLALQPPRGLTKLPPAWWGGFRDFVRIGNPPWHEQECRRLWKKYGPEKFKGLDLYPLTEKEG